LGGYKRVSSNTMEVPDNIFYRIYIRLKDNEYRKFYWFEMKDDELYWGPSTKVKAGNSLVKLTNPTTLTIKVSDDFKTLEPNTSKYSYHKSGAVHQKITEKSNVTTKIKSTWKLKDEIKEPTRIFWMISRTLENYPIESRNIEKKGGYCSFLDFNENEEKKRLYIEFYLSPKGHFPFPETIIKLDNKHLDTITHSLNKKIVLVVRYAKLVNLENWHPDKEVVMFPETI
jgi:hypothetical protein